MYVHVHTVLYIQHGTESASLRLLRHFQVLSRSRAPMFHPAEALQASFLVAASTVECHNGRILMELG